jgi:Arc/MetJ-type ribon-helix-helix transcriptional regulator
VFVVSDNNMKRKQFHLSVAEEQILYQIAKRNHISEAEVVRMAIRELAKSNLANSNTLLEMAEAARVEENQLSPDLSENHDQYLLEAYADET